MVFGTIGDQSHKKRIGFPKTASTYSLKFETKYCEENQAKPASCFTASPVLSTEAGKKVLSIFRPA